jgi:hypothetical protein
MIFVSHFVCVTCNIYKRTQIVYQSSQSEKLKQFFSRELNYDTILIF